MYPLISPRLVLRKYTPADEENFLSLFLHEDVVRYGSGPRDIEGLKALFEKAQPIYEGKLFAERMFHLWAICLEDGTYIGHCEMKQSVNTKPGELEIVYFFLPAYWGKGYATELVKALTDYAASLQRTVIATVHPANAASARVLEKAGFSVRETIADEEGESSLYALK